MAAHLGMPQVDSLSQCSPSTEQQGDSRNHEAVSWHHDVASCAPSTQLAKPLTHTCQHATLFSSNIGSLCRYFSGVLTKALPLRKHRFGCAGMGLLGRCSEHESLQSQC